MLNVIDQWWFFYLAANAFFLFNGTMGQFFASVGQNAETANMMFGAVGLFQSTFSGLMVCASVFLRCGTFYISMWLDYGDPLLYSVQVRLPSLNPGVKWLSNLSWTRWGFQALAINEISHGGKHGSLTTTQW